MTNTIIKGSPYTFTEFGQNTEAYLYSNAITKIFDDSNNAILAESGTAYTGDHIGIEITDSDNKISTYGSRYYYCINVPEGIRFLRVGNKVKISFPSAGAYLSTAAMRDAASLNYLMNFAKAQGMDVSARVDLSAYNDVAQISSYAKPGLSWAVATGIMSGTKTGDLMPGREATRAEGTKMFLNFYNMMMGN